LEYTALWELAREGYISRAPERYESKIEKQSDCPIRYLVRAIYFNDDTDFWRVVVKYYGGVNKNHDL